MPQNKDEFNGLTLPDMFMLVRRSEAWGVEKYSGNLPKKYIGRTGELNILLDVERVNESFRPTGVRINLWYNDVKLAGMRKYLNSPEIIDLAVEVQKTFSQQVSSEIKRGYEIAQKILRSN